MNTEVRDGLLSQNCLPVTFSLCSDVSDSACSSGERPAEAGAISFRRSKTQRSQARLQRAAEKGRSLVCAKLPLVPCTLQSKEEARHSRAGPPGDVRRRRRRRFPATVYS